MNKRREVAIKYSILDVLHSQSRRWGGLLFKVHKNSRISNH
ncbi:MAG: hypothetical protein CM15mP120_27240 [Pseudomonadota bacterium]|nr:MAG: hypothetical protein CM15mP120_27240 [Pseudomonadota bacterium]